MPYNKHSLIALLGFFQLVLLVGCSTETEPIDKVDQGSIYQSYSVTYDSKSDTTSVTAEFRFGGSSGTTLRLTGGASVKNNHAALSERSFLGTRYRGEKQGFHPNHTFEFVDVRGNRYVNSITLERDRDVNIPLQQGAEPGGMMSARVSK